MMDKKSAHATPVIVPQQFQRKVSALSIFPAQRLSNTEKFPKAFEMVCPCNPKPDMVNLKNRLIKFQSLRR
jgi:hypothetical protein